MIRTTNRRVKIDVYSLETRVNVFKYNECVCGETRGWTGNKCDSLVAGLTIRYRVGFRRVAKEIRRPRRASEKQSQWRMAGNSSYDLLTS